MIVISLRPISHLLSVKTSYQSHKNSHTLKSKARYFRTCFLFMSSLNKLVYTLSKQKVINQTRFRLYLSKIFTALQLAQMCMKMMNINYLYSALNMKFRRWRLKTTKLVSTTLVKALTLEVVNDQSFKCLKVQAQIIRII